MRYLKAVFRNYIGFYNGMGLNEIEIDFAKCIHKIILICGKNGSGKSTLLSHINPFPDSSSDFIPNMEACKMLTLSHEGDIYNIRIISPCDSKGRKTTKAYINKNGIELNENGNVSSYKEIIFSEFELDTNYISLFSLSSHNRGLGDKTPAERKKYVSSIIDNLEVFNSMYKTLNKKSLLYKSHINTLHTKIQNIGDKNNLESKLSSLQSKEKDLNTRILDANNKIITIQAKSSIDEEEALEIQKATEVVIQLKSELDLIKINLDRLTHKTKIPVDKIKETYDENIKLLDKYKELASDTMMKWKSSSNRLSEVSSNILSLKADLSSPCNEDNVTERYNKNKERIATLKDELKALGVEPDINLIMVISNIISFCEKFSTMIDRFNDNLTSSDVEFIVTKMSNQSYIERLKSELDFYLRSTEESKTEFQEIQSDLKLISVLDNRPSNCKIDTCPFIKEALSKKKSIKGDIIELLDESQKKVLSLSDKVVEINGKIDEWNTLLPKYTILCSIRSDISEISSTLMKFYPKFIMNFDSLLINMNTFSDIRDHKLLTDAYNLLKMLESELADNKVLEVEYKSYREKIQLLNSTKAMLEKLEKEEVELVDVVAKYKSEYDSANNTLESLKSNIETEAEYNSVFESYKLKLAEYNIANSKVEEYNRKSSKALGAISEINDLRKIIDDLGLELKPITQEINSISGQLVLLDSYYNEFNTYKQHYDMIETVKKYCSPTGGGIQTLFMQMYMGKTKELANQVLGMLFNGAYQLLDFVINENEFRIPFIGEGLPVDDISSGSSSQIAMMSMIINLVLMNQGSSKFNIAILDECDSGLDSYNRSQFINVLFHSMNALNVEQLFIISHSMEADNSYADIIKLRGYDDYESSITSGNVIFDYNDYIKEGTNK